MEALRKMKKEVEAKKKEALMMVKEEVEAKKDAFMKVKEGVEAKTEEALRRMKEGLEAKTEEALMKVMEEVEAKKDAFMKVKEDVEAKRDAFMKVKEEVEAMKREASMMVKEGAEEALMKLMEELEAKREGFMKVKEDLEAKKEAFMKVVEVAEANKMEALTMVKEGVEAKTEEALMKLLEDVEAKKQVFMKVKEDVEVKIEPVKTFILEALAGRNRTIIPSFPTTINTAVAAATAIEYDSDSSNSSKGSAESLNHEKVKAKSRKSFSSKIGGTVSSILYPVVNSPAVDVVVQQSHGQGIFYSGVKYSGVQESAVKTHQAEKDNVETKDFKGFSPSPQKIQDQIGSYTYLEEGSSSTGHGIVDLGIKTAEEATEIYLDKLYQNQEPHKFYCPNCNICITKVLIIRERLPEKKELICTNCFSFLIPEGNWVRNIFGSKKQEIPATETGLEAVSRAPGEDIEIPMQLRAEPRSSKSWQILKSIVYGGLAESITSLGIVTSAASADAATLNIMALALANLIGGLFTIVHNLWQFKNDESTVTSEETGEQVKRYQEVLGRKENFFLLHAPAAILSFLIFGLVPPVVYGFSFRESDDKDLKIAAVAGASLICITLLALAKARTKKNPNYIQTVLQYVAVGFGVSGASYAAGNLLDRLMEQLGWFQQTHGDETFPLPQFM